MTILTPATLTCMSIVFVIWLANELFVEFHNQSNSSHIAKEAKRNNTYLVGGTGLCLIVLGAFLTTNLAGSSLGLIPFTFLSYFGSGIALFGIVLRRFAINALKDNFDGIIQIKEKQELNTQGLYQWVRHPSYTGSILFFMGFGLASLNIFTFVILTSFIFIIYHVRIRYEEKVLTDAFGTDYLQYKKTTNAFFPSYKTIKQIGVKHYVQKSQNRF